MIESAKQTLPKFKVVELNVADFLSCEYLLTNFCTNRKKTVQKEDVNWFSFRKITYQKGQPMILFFETYHDIVEKYDERFEIRPNHTKQLSVAKRHLNIDEFRQFELQLLYPEGRAIATKKKADLLELLDYIDIEHRGFYKNLTHCEEETNEKAVEEIIEISEDEN